MARCDGRGVGLLDDRRSPRRPGCAGCGRSRSDRAASWSARSRRPVSALWAAIRSASVSASSSGTSPEVTTTMPAKSSGSADSPQPTAWPGAELLLLHRDVDRCGPARRPARRPRARSGRGHGRARRPGAAGATLATECSACDSMLRPASVCSTFGVSDRIRVPAPAARTRTAVSVASRLPLTSRACASCRTRLELSHRSHVLPVAPSPGLEPELSEPKSEVLPITPRRNCSESRLLVERSIA